jgi:hypothetical protein
MAMWDYVRSVLVWLSNLPPAGWAALAAGFSAIASFLIWRIQRSNLLESVRPELVLLDWSRETQGDLQTYNSRAVIAFPRIKNVGRGAAFNVWLNVYPHIGDRYTAQTIRLPIIAVNEEVALADGRIIVWFNDPAVKGVNVPLTVSSWDSRGNVYETVYNLLVVRGDIPFRGSTIAENLDATRTTTMTPAWRLHFRARRERLLPRLSDFWKRVRSKLSR